jgi:hypothetical protein
MYVCVQASVIAVNGEGTQDVSCIIREERALAFAKVFPVIDGGLFQKPAAGADDPTAKQILTHLRASAKSLK